MNVLVYWNGEPGAIEGLEPDEYLVWDCDANHSMPGWYWLMNGSLEDPNGPFSTEKDALRARLS